jgi:DNA repair protein RadC
MGEAGEAPPHYLGHRQRLRERFLAAGGDSLADYEMLELVLSLALRRGDVKPLAKALLQRFGSYADVIAAEPAALAEVKGVGEGVIAALKIVQSAAVRLARQQVVGKEVLSNWQQLLDYCQARMGREGTEEFHVLYLNRKNVLIRDERQQRGTVDHTPVYPREVVKRALELGATALIMVHNHPSGDATPSRGDIEMTREIKEVGEKLGIQLHDHVIVGRAGTNSFRSLGLL